MTVRHLLSNRLGWASALVLALTVAVLIGRGVWPTRPDGHAHADSVWAHVPGPFGRSQIQSDAPTALASASPSTVATSTPDLQLQDSSLSGTEADGDWGVDSRGVLQPNRSLRRRFDYYLSLIGERDLRTIDAYVAHQAQSALPQSAARAVLDVWQRYLRLQQFAWQHHVDPRQPASWRAALEERQRVRADLLGSAWAYAFYGEEERESQADIWRIQNGDASQPAVQTQMVTTDPLASEDPQAQARVAEVQARWAAWERRVEDARKAIAAIESSANLSAIQRDQAIQTYLAAQFDAQERMRVQALLRL